MDKPKEYKSIPGRTNPLSPWGDAISFFRDYYGFKQNKLEQYGEVFKMKFFSKEITALYDKEAVAFSLVKNGKQFYSKEAWDLVLKDLFPNGLMLMDGEKHKHHRSIITAAFKKEPMEGYLEILKKTVSPHLSQWNDSNPKMFPTLKKLTLEIALQLFFGIDKDESFTKINTAISDIVEASSAVPIKLPFTAYSKGIKARKFLVHFFEELLPEKKKNTKNDLFSILATAQSEEGHKLKDEEIIDHLIFILMAAHDTTASTLTSLVYFLAKHPEWQHRLRLEASHFYSEHGDNFGILDLRKLENLSLALKETLRLYPPLVTVGRVSNQELEYKDFKLPKGTHVSLNFEHNHHNPEIWSCPADFDPDRFSKERSEQTKCPFTYTPFGAGEHHCIGFAFGEMQIKYIISRLLLSHEWSVPADYEMPVKPVPIQMPEDGLPVFMKKL